jgi:hypothetical protein
MAEFETSTIPLVRISEPYLDLHPEGASRLFEAVSIIEEMIQVT